MYKKWMVLVLHEFIIEWLKIWSYELCWSLRGVEGAASFVFFSRFVWQRVKVVLLAKGCMFKVCLML
jgi:hypothetical protein